MPATAKADPLAADRLRKKFHRAEETTEERTAPLQSLREYLLERINTFSPPSFTSLSLLTCVSSHTLSSFHAYICILLPIHHSSYHSFLHNILQTHLHARHMSCALCVCLVLNLYW